VPPEGYSHDLFISHTSEDKDRFVRPLAEALRTRGVTVWYDDWELEVGDPLSERINDGLSHSRFGVVVLSPGFFNKNWPKAELEALAALEMRQGQTRLLPIWLDLGADEISSVAPLLLARVALRAEEGVEVVADKLASKVQRREQTTSPQASPPAPRILHPLTVAAQALPNSYNPPLANDESGFVFRTVAALAMPVGQDQHLSSQHKRGFQAIVSDSAVEGLLQKLADHPWAPPSAPWGQTQPSSGTVATVARPVEIMGGRDGTVEARSGLLLRSNPFGDGHAIAHLDIVLRPPVEMRSRCLLSLDDFYSPALGSGRLAPGGDRPGRDGAAERKRRASTGRAECRRCPQPRHLLDLPRSLRLGRSPCPGGERTARGALERNVGDRDRDTRSVAGDGHSHDRPSVLGRWLPRLRAVARRACGRGWTLGRRLFRLRRGRRVR
jgi:hypothetical protein